MSERVLTSEEEWQRSEPKPYSEEELYRLEEFSGMTGREWRLWATIRDREQRIGQLWFELERNIDVRDAYEESLDYEVGRRDKRIASMEFDLTAYGQARSMIQDELKAAGQRIEELEAAARRVVDTIEWEELCVAIDDLAYVVAQPEEGRDDDDTAGH